MKCTLPPSDGGSNIEKKKKDNWENRFVCVGYIYIVVGQPCCLPVACSPAVSYEAVGCARVDLVPRIETQAALESSGELGVGVVLFLRWVLIPRVKSFLEYYRQCSPWPG